MFMIMNTWSDYLKDNIYAKILRLNAVLMLLKLPVKLI